MPMLKGARVLIVIQDHGVITSVPEDCQKSLAGLVFLFFFQQKFIMGAVFDHRLNFFLGCKTASG